MAIKYREAEELRQTTRQNLARSVENWTAFLNTAGNTYKYSFSDQLLIFAQFPNAKAVGSFDLWSERFGRKIRTGSKGIGLIDTSGSHPKIRYVFDISQSTANSNIPQPKIWQLEEEYKKEAAFFLSGDTNHSIEKAVSDLAENTVDEVLDRYLDDIIARKSESVMLAELDDDTVKTEFRELLFESVRYTAFVRCGLEPLKYDNDVFRNLANFSDLAITDILGGAVSDVSENVLREIENEIKSIERRNRNEQSNKSNQRHTAPVVQGGLDILSNNEKGRTDRFDLQARPQNIRVSSQHDGGRRYEGHRKMGTQETEISQREQARSVYGDVRQSQPDRPSDRNQSAGRDNVGDNYQRSREGLGRDGRTESSPMDRMGTQSELGTNDSGRTSDDRPDLRITEQSNTPIPKAEDNQSPAFSVTQGEQLGLFADENNIAVTDIDDLLENIPENADLPTEDYKSEIEFEIKKQLEGEMQGKEKQTEINFVSESDYDIESRQVLNVNGGSIYTIPIKTTDSLLHRLAEHGVVPTDQMKQVYLGSDYGTSWNKLFIMDKWGNKHNNVNISEVFTQEELHIAQAILEKVNDLEHPKAEQEILSSDGNEGQTEMGIEAERQQQVEILPTSEKTENYHITDLSLGQTKLSEKFKNNLEAIKTLKAIEAENRTAASEEQKILSQYAGWGGLAKIFEPDNIHYSELKDLLTEEEFIAARKSTLSAFYTSPVIVKEMYAKLAEMGFENGKLLEPSCGVGNFVGMIPESMNVKVSGVELDSLTGRIAKTLYPNANIQVCGFENAKLKEGSFDVAVGNVPFGDFKVYDKKYNPHNLLIHDYFFSKSLDMVKSGGIVAFISSAGTLDKKSSTARKELAEKAEFLGAVRLPNTAFKANADTEVTSDIIFLKKRDTPITITPENEPLWLRTAKDENGIEMNAYFAENPQQICGTMEMVSGRYGMTSTCQPNRDSKLSEQIQTAMANIHGTISTSKSEIEEAENIFDNIEVPDNLRNSSYFLSGSKAYFFEVGNIKPVEFPKSREKKILEKLSGMIAIRDTVRQLLEMQLDERTSDEEIKEVQNTLSSLYSDFVIRNGRLNNVSNISVFKNDSSLPLLRSLEKLNQKGEFIGKADIFSKRTVKAQATVSKVENAVDALAVSISEKAQVDLDFMSDLTGLEKDKLIEDLTGSIYKVPNTDDYVTADEYLSGDILVKLNTAKTAYENGDTSMAVNMSALEKSMPERVGAAEIDVRLGATWLKPEYIRQFVHELLQTPMYYRISGSKNLIDVQYSETTGKWNITNKAINKENPLANTTYGTNFKSAYHLIEDILNLKSQVVKDRETIDGKEQWVVNRDKTAALQAKAETVKQKFADWIFADKTRRDDIVNAYNELFNTIRPREYDGSHLNFVGMNPEISLRSHQLNAVARCLYGGNTLLAHEVGAGKSATRS